MVQPASCWTVLNACLVTDKSKESGFGKKMWILIQHITHDSISKIHQAADSLRTYEVPCFHKLYFAVNIRFNETVNYVSTF